MRVLEHNDGIVYDQPNREYQRQQRDEIDREPEGCEDSESGDKADGNRHERDQHRAQATEKYQYHQTNQCGRYADRPEDGADRCIDIDGVIATLNKLHTVRQVLIYSVDLRLDGRQDFNGIGCRLLNDAEACR